MRLSATGLTCVRGGRTVFAGVEFSLAAGKALAVTGPNGAGKSSLLRILAGLLQAAAGEVGLAGGGPEREIAEQAHYLGHLDALKPSLTVAENLQFWASYLGQPRMPADTALAETGLGGLAGLPAAYLSAGQRRRLSIARLLAVHRPLWLLDEPQAALDAAAQARLTAIMKTHLAEGGLIVAAVHSPLGIDGVRELRLGDSA